MATSVWRAMASNPVRFVLSRWPWRSLAYVVSSVAVISIVWLAVLPLLLFPPKEDKPVPVEEEPLHKVELKNNAVTVIHLTLPAGQYTKYHIHTHDRVAIQLSATSTTQQDWKKPEGSANPLKPGDFSAMTLQGDSYTHRVHNVGNAPDEVLDIEFAQRPATPSPDLS